MKRKRYFGFSFLLLIVGLSLNGKYAFAENKASMEEGIVTYMTEDTTATSGITWGTLGFTVRNGKTYGNPIKDSNYGKFMLDDGEKTMELRPGGVTNVTFTFPAEKTEAQFEKANVNSVSLKKNGGYVYINGIHQVYHNGVAYGSPKYTKEKIEDAEDWKKSNDFDDRFDIAIHYDPVPQPVHFTIMKYSSSGGYKEMSNVKDGSEEKVPTGLVGEYPAGSTYTTNTSSIPGTIKSDTTDNTLYLYKVYWTRLKEAKYQYTEKGDPYRKPRDKISISLSEFNPLANWEGYKDAIRPLRNRSGTSTDKYADECPFYEVVYGGIEIVCVYTTAKMPIDPEVGEQEQELEIDIVDPEPSGVIQADTRYNEVYNSERGIPTTETQYSCVMSEDYLVQYKFVHYAGYKDFIQKSGSSQTLARRYYSYWKLADLNVYTISYATVYNGSLPGGGIALTPTSYYNKPTVNYQVYSSNLVEPTGGGTSVGQYTVWNDSLTFNGETIMSNTHCSGTTVTPKLIPTSGKSNVYTLFGSGYAVPATKANGEYVSSGVVCYTRTTHYGGDANGNSIIYTIEDINDVTVHTPVICNAKIEDMKKYNQLIEPNQTMASLVLDTFFNVQLPTYGYHSDLKGYGTRDYLKYTSKREAKFPFDVYKGGVYVPANTWTTISTETEFYLPAWVNEGQYNVEFRTRAINCDANNGLDQTEEFANTNYENYVATDSVDVEVSGRIYNFNLFDISDYPVWKNVFRQSNSMKFTGANYTVGTKDRNGVTALDWKNSIRTTKYTLPVMQGSHPTYSTIGPIKSGYYTRFSVDTIGNYDGADDYIRITPKFYYVNGKGQNRQEVDLYYTERFETTKKKNILVKVGSELDKTNTHKINRTDTRITGTGYLKGTPSTTLTQKQVYTFGNIMIPNSLMSFIGNTSYFKPQQTITTSSLLEKQKKAVQTWICEYYLPSDLHVCAKGFDVEGYAKDHRIDYSESFWKTMGYVIVNFEIETIQDGNRHLSYINASNATKGYCNMWKMEGAASSKTDAYGNLFTFKDGDYVLYYVSGGKSVRSDYKSGGIY